MVSSPSYPAQPSPAETASAQTSENVNSAIANNAMNKTNQVDAYGNTLTYKQTGTTHTTDANGKTYDIPTYTAYQAFSPDNQAIADQTQSTKLNLAKIGNYQTQKIGNLLSTNADLSAANVDKYTNDHWQPGFDRQWNNQQAALQQKLADQGVTAGSQAYQNSMRDFTTSRQSAEDQYLGDMYGNAQKSIVQERDQPINEITALMSGSQINPASYAQTSTSPLSTTDYAGIEQNWYSNEMAKANAQAQSNNSLTGGLFGLGSSLLGGWAFGGFKGLSDRRLKMDIERVGKLENGLSVYEFEYIWGGGRETGLMADEVLRVHPDAVEMGPGGFLMVDYEKAVL